MSQEKPPRKEQQPLGLAIFGLGTAGAVMLAAALSHERIRVVAVADPRITELPLSLLPRSVKRYADLESLLEDDEVEAIHVATPTPYHLEHAAAILRRGKSTIVEKPMVSDRNEAVTLMRIMDEAPAALIVGHSSSFEPEVRAAATLAHDPTFGNIVSIVSTKSTEWLRRPRLPEELDPARGGGILRRQGVHQVDVIRTILGETPLSVVQASVRLDRNRGDLGSYLAWLRTPIGQTISLYYDGVGGSLPADSLTLPSDGTRTFLAGEMTEKRRRSDLVLAQLLAGEIGRVVDHDRGETVVLGTRAELRISANCLVRSDDAKVVAIDLTSMPSGHAAVLDELLLAVAGGRTRHNASWGYENIKICEDIEARAKIN